MPYNKIVLHGKQRCNYIYIQNDPVIQENFSGVGDEPSEWSSSTALYANFNNKEMPLNAGDSNFAGTISGYDIYRRKYNESICKYIGKVHKADKGKRDLMVDYAAKNGVDYVYYFYPNTDKSEGGSALSPLVTKQVSLDCPYWSLLIVDETKEENVFYLDKLFKFELNLEVNDMTNNAHISITQNFTKYPTVQYGSANYWSGSLTALCGFISANGVEYVQNTNMIDELKSIASDTRRKFLKDIMGNIWEVGISAPINISTTQTSLVELKTLHFSWVEVGDANGISIINNPEKNITDWVLTESGQAIPYYTYTWDEQYRWDDSYYWTGQKDSTPTYENNMGRSIKR